MIKRNIIFGLEEAKKNTDSDIKKTACDDFINKLNNDDNPTEILKNAARVLSHRRWSITARCVDKKSASYEAAENYFQAAREFAKISDSEWNALLTDKPGSTVKSEYTFAFFAAQKKNPVDAPVLSSATMTSSL